MSGAIRTSDYSGEIGTTNSSELYSGRSMFFLKDFKERAGKKRRKVFRLIIKFSISCYGRETMDY